MYKNGVQLTPPFTLMPGENIVLAVLGSGNPTKARFRINNDIWIETTTQNSADEFTLNYEIPDNISTLSVDAEVFVNGEWR